MDSLVRFVCAKARMTNVILITPKVFYTVQSSSAMQGQQDSWHLLVIFMQDNAHLEMSSSVWAMHEAGLWLVQSWALSVFFNFFQQ